MLGPYVLPKLDKNTPKTYNYKNVPHQKNYFRHCYSHLFLLQYFSHSLKHSLRILSLYRFHLLSLRFAVVCTSSSSTWYHRHLLFVYPHPFNKNYSKNLSVNILVIMLKSLNHYRNACFCLGYLKWVWNRDVFTVFLNLRGFYIFFIIIISNYWLVL